MKALRITLIANAFLEAQIDHLSAAMSRDFARKKIQAALVNRKPEEQASRGFGKTKPPLVARAAALVRQTAKIRPRLWQPLRDGP